MVDMVPAHSAMTVCQDSRISGSAAMAESSLCHSVIQSCASLRGSGMSDAALPRDVESLKPASYLAFPNAQIVEFAVSQCVTKALVLQQEDGYLGGAEG